MSKIWINGQFYDEWDALVSVRDRGFRFGDGVFETIPVYNNQPFQLKLHLDRLEGSLQSISITYDLTKFIPYIQRIVTASKSKDMLLRISITRGTGSQGYMPTNQGEPICVMETSPFPPPFSSPISLRLSPFRKVPSVCLPVRYKLSQGMNSVLAKMEARENGFEDALQLTTEDKIAESSSANIFWITEGELFTPSLETGILGGITRHTVLKIYKGVKHEGTFTLADLKKADEVFLTNSSRGVTQVGKIETIKDYLITEKTSMLKAAYQQEIDHACYPTTLA